MTDSIARKQITPKRRMYLVESHSDLLKKIANEQCSESFRQLFNHYSKKIFNYGMKNNLTESTASDLVQEVMTRIWTRSKQYSPEKGSASAWIFTIARNVRYDILRKGSREDHVLSADEIWSSGEESAFIDQDADPEQLLSSKNVRNFVKQLPDVQEEVITEIYFNGFTHEEYAAKKQLPLGTVKSRIRLGIRKLNKLMESL